MPEAPLIELDELRQILDVIEANQQRFDRTRGLRARYRICKENEALFARLGIRFPPMFIPRGLVGWWMTHGG